MDLLELHEISEADHRIMNPLSETKLLALAGLCRVGPGTRILDLACGKGELLCRWAQTHGAGGVGVDISATFLDAAAARADELGVADRVRFVRADAGSFVAPGSFDLTCCVGATWIGGGLAGTVELLRAAVGASGLLLVGEPFWVEPPPADAYAALGFRPDEFTSLAGTLDRFEGSGMDLVELVISTPDDWDRHRATQWWTLTEWLRAHRGDARWEEVRAFRDNARRSYLAFGRRYLGWGVFVLSPFERLPATSNG